MLGDRLLSAGGGVDRLGVGSQLQGGEPEDILINLPADVFRRYGDAFRSQVGIGDGSYGVVRGVAASLRRRDECRARNARTCSTASWHGMQSALQLSSSSLPPSLGVRT